MKVGLVITPPVLLATLLALALWLPVLPAPRSFMPEAPGLRSAAPPCRAHTGRCRMAPRMALSSATACPGSAAARSDAGRAAGIEQQPAVTPLVARLVGVAMQHGVAGSGTSEVGDVVHQVQTPAVDHQIEMPGSRSAQAAVSTLPRTVWTGASSANRSSIAASSSRLPHRRGAGSAQPSSIVSASSRSVP